jgi:hypothetical protein
MKKYVFCQHFATLIVNAGDERYQICFQVMKIFIRSKSGFLTSHRGLAVKLI